MLVIDDEPLIGRLCRIALSNYEVEVLTDARVALARLRENPNVSAILCDLAMPDLDGQGFFAELSRELPSLVGRVCFVTGGGTTAGSEAFLRDRQASVLVKPFTLSDLEARVTELVHQSSGL